MSRMMMTPSMSDFVADFRRRKQQEAGSASVYDSTPRPLNAMTQHFSPDGAQDGPERLNFFDQMAGMVPQQNPIPDTAGMADYFLGKPPWLRTETAAAPPAAPATQSAGGYGAFMMPGWDGKPMPSPSAEPMLPAPPREVGTPRNDLPPSTGGYGAFMLPGWDGKSAATAPGEVAPSAPGQGLGFNVDSDGGLLDRLRLMGMSSGSPSATPPMATGQSVHAATIRNAAGDLLSRMEYGQNPDGSYMPGVTTDRRGGYNARGQYENEIANSVERFRGPMTPEMQLRDVFERNLADRRGNPFGYGMNPREAFGRAQAEVGMGLQGQAITGRMQEAQLDRENRLQLEQMQQEGANQRAMREKSHGIAASIIKSTFDQARASGMDPAQAMQYAVQAERQAMNPGAAAAPGALDERMRQAQSGRSALASLLPNLPAGVQINNGAPGGRPSIAQGGAKEFGVNQTRDLFNSMLGQNLDEAGTAQLIASLRAAGPEGEKAAETIFRRALSDQMMMVPPTAEPSTIGRIAGIFPGLALAGVGSKTYPAEVTMGEFPGLSVKGDGSKGGNYWDRGGRPYTKAVLPGGQEFPLDLSGSRGPTFNNQAFMDKLKAQEDLRKRIIGGYLQSRR